MSKIYISGPITGTTDYMERFEKAEKLLKSKGYSVVNPADLLQKVEVLEEDMNLYII